MQHWSREGVRQERTGWRDERISARHRDWGFNCPAVDLDFLMVEYNLGKPVALVEYKHHQAMMPNVKHPTYRALIDLADGYRDDPLLALISFYWPEVWAFKVFPINGVAKEWFADGEGVSEYDYVTRLYRMRRFKLAKELEGKLRTELPPLVAA